MPSKKMTTNEFKNKVKEKYGERVDVLSEYNGGTSPIDIVYHCKKHGDIHKTLNAKNIIAKTFQPCDECNKEIHSKKSKERSKKTKEDLISELKNVCKDNEGGLLSIKWTKSKDLYDFKCKEGHIFKNSADHVMNGGQWCPYCIRRKGDFEDEIKDIIHSKNGMLLNEYINANTHVDVKCNEHNYIWSIMPLNIRKGRWCPICSLKYSEKVVYDYLISNKYNIKSQYTFDDLLSSKNEILRFDFAIFDEFDNLKFLLEVDEESHRVKSNKQYVVEAQNRDRMKDNYCLNNDIKLYRLPIERFKKYYKNYDTYYEYIENYFKNTRD